MFIVSAYNKSRRVKMCILTPTFYNKRKRPDTYLTQYLIGLITSFLDFIFKFYLRLQHKLIKCIFRNLLTKVIFINEYFYHCLYTMHYRFTNATRFVSSNLQYTMSGSPIGCSSAWSGFELKNLRYQKRRPI